MSVSIADFCEKGFVAVRNAVPLPVVRECVGAIEQELRARAVDPRDAGTWIAPVVRVNCPEGPAFAAAGRSAALREVYDALLGPGGWIPRDGVGGTVPVRFPSTKDPGDAGWHIDGSYDVAGQWWVNVRSRGRGLLALFLFTDVTDADAPTEVVVGSHLDVPPALAPFGDRGVFFGDVIERLPEATLERPPGRVRPAVPATCTSVIPFSCTARRGHIGASRLACSRSHRSRSASRSRFAPMVTSAPWSERSCAASGKPACR